MKITTQWVKLLTKNLRNWVAPDCLKEVKAMMMESKSRSYCNIDVLHFVCLQGWWEKLPHPTPHFLYLSHQPAPPHTREGI